MTIVKASDAKARFNALLERAAKGEVILITRRGVPVAELVPALLNDRKEPRELVREIRSFRKGVTLGIVPIQLLINNGR